MTMRVEDMHEIIKGTVEHFRVRCDHRHVKLTDEEIEKLRYTLEGILLPYADNSADTGGEWDND